MARSTGSRRNSLFWILSVVLVASMVCSYMAVFSPPRQATPTRTPPAPTRVLTRALPTWTPTPTPTAATTAVPVVAPGTLSPPERRTPSPTA